MIFQLSPLALKISILKIYLVVSFCQFEYGRFELATNLFFLLFSSTAIPIPRIYFSKFDNSANKVLKILP